MWVFFWVIFAFKLGKNWNFDLFWAHWLRLWPYIYMPYISHISIGGQFRGFESYRSRGKKENKAEKGKRREKLEMRKTNLQPPFSGCKSWAFFTIKLGKNAKISLYLPMKWGVRHIYIYTQTNRLLWVNFWHYLVTTMGLLWITRLIFRECFDEIILKLYAKKLPDSYLMYLLRNYFGNWPKVMM